jgi:hypothetical protein
MAEHDKDAWFRPKRYGLGWTPANWKGWVVTLGGVAIFVLIVIRLL